MVSLCVVGQRSRGGERDLTEDHDSASVPTEETAADGGMFSLFEDGEAGRWWHAGDSALLERGEDWELVGARKRLFCLLGLER